MTFAEDQVRVEAELAKQLLAAGQDERWTLYGDVYDEIYSMHLSRDPATLEFGAFASLLPFLWKLTEDVHSVLEVGCGAGLMAIELARAGREVTGVDVSEVILDKARSRARSVPGVVFEHVSGIALPYSDSAFDCAYSIEVLEHLHEDDAEAHLAEIRRVLRPEGRYWFMTPNALHSVGASDRFGVVVDNDADVHLKEWTYGELASLLRAAGFGRAAVPFRPDRALRVPWMPISVIVRVERSGSPLLHRLLPLGHCSIVAFR